MQSVVKTLVKKRSKLIDLGTAADRRAMKIAVCSKDFSKKQSKLIDLGTAADRRAIKNAVCSKDFSKEM